MTVISLRKRFKPAAPRFASDLELRNLRRQLRAASALLDDPCHWCDPAENPSCEGCARRAPDWRKGAAR